MFSLIYFFHHSWGIFKIIVVDFYSKSDVLHLNTGMRSTCTNRSQPFATDWNDWLHTSRCQCGGAVCLVILLLSAIFKSPINTSEICWPMVANLRQLWQRTTCTCGTHLSWQKLFLYHANIFWVSMLQSPQMNQVLFTVQ